MTSVRVFESAVPCGPSGLETSGRMRGRGERPLRRSEELLALPMKAIKAVITGANLKRTLQRRGWHASATPSDPDQARAAPGCEAMAEGGPAVVDHRLMNHRRTRSRAEDGVVGLRPRSASQPVALRVPLPHSLGVAGIALGGFASPSKRPGLCAAACRRWPCRPCRGHEHVDRRFVVVIPTGSGGGGSCPDPGRLRVVAL
jgi:hypothetical protein